MKRYILTIAILIMLAPSTLSAPNYDPNHKCTTYDVSYNIALRNKLENDFQKKYFVKEVVTKDSVEMVYSYPTDAYYEEVLKPYCLQKKPDDYKIIKD